jgi:hypothetical protein
MSIVLGGLTNKFFETFWLLEIFWDGMFTAGSVWALNAIIEYFENNGK